MSFFSHVLNNLIWRGLWKDMADFVNGGFASVRAKALTTCLPKPQRRRK